MHTSSLLCSIGVAAALAAIPVTVSLRGPPSFAWATASAATDVNINLFFTSLSPHGAWVPSPDYNYVWVPTQVDADWAPYTNGRWIYTAEYGWYFASDEPYAWVVYHYGRWGFDPQIGWYWVPGTQWAPAWVAWRKNDANIGWAPLPPQGQGYAVNFSVNINFGEVPQHYWRFVPANQFLAPQLRTVAFAGDRRPDLYIATQPAGFVTVQNNVVVNNVINITFIEQQTNTKVQVAKVETVADPKDAIGAQANTSAAIKAFVASSAAPPDKAVAPPKVVAKAEVQAPTKGQTQAAAPAPATAAVTPNAGALPTAPGTAPATTAPATAAGPAAVDGSINTRCIDPTFAKANPKDCAAPADVAATPSAGSTPGAVAPAGNPGAPGAATGTVAVPGNLAPPANPRCLDATFARNNPKDCATPAGAAPATAGVAPNAGAAPAAVAVTPKVEIPAVAVTPKVEIPAVAVTPKVEIPAVAVTPKVDAAPPAAAVVAPKAAAPAPAAAVSPTIGAPPAGAAGAAPRGTASVNAPNASCVDPTFARNNPKTCTVGGPAATAGPAAPVAPVGIVPPPANAVGGISVQGNAALGNARCADPTFAKANALTCGAIGGGDARPAAILPPPAQR